MNIYSNNFNKPFLRILALLCTLPFLCAWVDPVDLSVDINGTGAVEIEGIAMNSCAAVVALVPSRCHRWNLVWEPVINVNGLEEVIDWNPNIPADVNGKEWRLPTIKELTRLVDFGVKDTTTLLKSTTIKSWFTSDDFWSTANQLSFGDGSKTVWLISSTYRDIDENAGDSDEGAKGKAQIFAINIINGEVKTFEPGYKSLGQDQDPVNELSLCSTLNRDGGCNYGNVPENTIFALKVRTKSVEDLK